MLKTKGLKMAEITNDSSKMGEVKAEVTIIFYENGIGINATKTGVSRSQLVRGALALLGEVGQEGLNNIGESLATYEMMVKMLKEAKEVLDNKKDEGCRGSEN